MKSGHINKLSQQGWVLLCGLITGFFFAVSKLAAQQPTRSEESLRAAQLQNYGRSGTNSDGETKTSLVLKSEDVAGKLDQFEIIMEQYYRHPVIEKTRTSMNQLVDDYNRWIATNQTRLAVEQKKLKERADGIRQLETLISGSDNRLERQRPDPSDGRAVETYNTLVAERNAQAKHHAQLAESFQRDQQSFKAVVDQFNREQTAGQERIEAAKREAAEQGKAYRNWFESKQDIVFFNSLNRFYAQLHQDRQPQLDTYLDRVRAVRRELGERFTREQAKDRAGLLVVKATLCRREECFLAVDTGANSVTISPALVAALGLSDRLGKEVEASLAGGVRIKGRELIIPQLSVLGQEARDVDAVVIDEPAVGLDGLLGLSFLSRFSYRIEKGERTKLVLKPQKGP